jgi:hypothetical protein
MWDDGRRADKDRRGRLTGDFVRCIPPLCKCKVGDKALKLKTQGIQLFCWLDAPLFRAGVNGRTKTPISLFEE